MIKAKESSKVIGGRISMIGKALLEVLEYDLEIQYEINDIFISKPIFVKYTEVDNVYKNLLKTTIPCEQHWDKLCELLE